MTQAIRIITIAAATTCAACFGAGPEPSAPAKATVVYGVAPQDPSVCQWSYIGDVAFAQNLAFVLEIPYGPSNCGGNMPNAPIDVMQFSKTGGGRMKIGTAGMTYANMMNVEPHLVVAADQNAGAVWAFGDNSSNSLQFQTTPPNVDVATVSNIGGALNSMVAVDQDIYFVIAPSGGSQPNNVFFPGRGLAQNNSNMETMMIERLHGSAASGSVTASCGYANHCMAASADSIYYFSTNPGAGTGGNQVQIRGFPRGTDPAQVGSNFGSLPGNGNTYPVGIVTDATSVIYAWTDEIDTPQVPSPACQIVRTDIASGQSMQLLQTPRFGCMDLATDGTYVYFAITTIEPSNQDNNNGNNTNNTMHGLGIGRIAIANGDFTSIAVDIEGVTSGPRRVYVDATSIYAVDPHVIGKIDKSALDNAHDFSAQ